MAEFHLAGSWSVGLRRPGDGAYRGDDRTYAELRVSEYSHESSGEQTWPPHTVMVGTFGSPGELQELLDALSTVHEQWIEENDDELARRHLAQQAAEISGWLWVDQHYLNWRRFHPLEEDGIVF